MKKSKQPAPTVASQNPAFWVDACPRAPNSGGPSERRAFDRPFGAEAGMSRRLPAIRHYVVYDEPVTGL